MKIAERHAAQQATKQANPEVVELKSKPDPLTKDNLSKHDDVVSQAASSKKKKKSKAEKPAWAVTEKQKEDAKEAEIDELLEFAYELDYEKYMEDYEVR